MEKTYIENKKRPFVGIAIKHRKTSGLNVRRLLLSLEKG